jgi:hypothetical protein
MTDKIIIKGKEGNVMGNISVDVSNNNTTVLALK